MSKRPLPILRPLALVALPLAAIACLASLGVGGRGPSAPPVLAYVSNGRAGDLTVVDTARDEVVGAVRVGDGPRRVRVDASGARVFVVLSGATAGSAGSGVSRAALDLGTDGIAVVDARARRVSSILPSGRAPEDFDFLPGGTLVVSSREGGATLVDVAGARVVGTLEVGGEPRGVAAAGDGSLVAVTSGREHRVDLLDPDARRAIARVPTCRRPRAVVLVPGGALAFATCEDSAAVAVVDVREGRALAEIPLPEAARPAGAALSPDGTRLYVANGAAGSVSAIDVPSRTVALTAEGVGANCRGLAVTPDGRKLYVAAGATNDVAVLEASTLRLLRRIPVGGETWDVAAAPSP